MTEIYDWNFTRDYSYRDNIPKTEFTKAHLEAFKAHTKNWKLKAFSTAAIDKPKATAAINALYELDEHEPPLIVWTQSPLANVFAKVLCDEILGLNPEDRVWNNCSPYDDVLWQNIGPNTMASVNNVTTSFCVVNRDGLRKIVKNGELWGAFGYMDDQGVNACRDFISNGLQDAIRTRTSPNAKEKGENPMCQAGWADICKTVERSLGVSPSEISDDLYKQEIKEKFSACHVNKYPSYGSWDYPENNDVSSASYAKRKLCSAISDNTYTQFDMAKLSEYMALFDADLIPKTEHFNELHKLCEAAGWVMPHRTVCYVSQRPIVLKVDEIGLPHCEDGPAVMYADGFSLYALHGVTIPKFWTQRKLSAWEVLNTLNLEQRRVGCELVGWDKIINEVQAELIDKDDDPEIGELVKCHMPDVGMVSFLRVKCGTGRQFALPVPPEMRTAQQANAWTWGLESGDYTPEVRT